MFFFFANSSLAASLEERIRALEDTLQKQEQMIQEQQEIIKELTEEVGKSKAAVPVENETKSVEKKEEIEEAEAAVRDFRLDDRSRAIEMDTGAPITPYDLRPQKAPSLLNPAISLIVDFNYYNSNLSNEELEERTVQGYLSSVDEGHEEEEEEHEEEEGGHGHGHGSFENGFNLRSAELFFFAPVDPYFNLYSNIVFTEHDVEVEEAYFVTTSLPAGLQVKGGKFKSGFGRFNAFHPHAWNFVDANLPYTVFLGPEGLLEKGVQLTYLPPLSIYTLLGGEILQGDNEIQYGEDAEDDPHAFTLFAKSSVDVSDNGTILFGASVTDGKTKTESLGHDTVYTADSTLYNGEITYKWKPSKDRSFLIQSEYLLRDQDGDIEEHEGEHTESLKRKQDGLYVQALYQFNRWRVGVRYDVLDIFTDDFILDGENIDFGSDPYRLTGSLEYNPTEFSRIRLQYTHDRSDRDGPDNNELFLQFIMGIGAHGAHTF
jgi:uncharacterized coiled-coil protein SlyX